MQTNWRFLTSLTGAIFTLAMVHPLRAADDKKLPEGKPALTPGLAGHRQNAGPDGEAEFKVIAVEGQAFKQAIQAKVNKRPSEVWHTQISTLLAQPVKRGDVVLISFQVRGKASFNVYFGTPETELEVTFAEELSSGDKWKLVQIPATAADNYEPGLGMLNFDFGFDPQTIEFGDIKLINYGRNVKEGDLPRSGY